jgi:hypothetical protein
MLSTKKSKGCLLAHTMGLGKTLQVIALLITLSMLPNDVRMEMPDDLRKQNRRFLVVCPPGIVNNWERELKHWTPRDCVEARGDIYCVNELSLEYRMDKIHKWFQRGGVLISIPSQFCC